MRKLIEYFTYVCCALILAVTFPVSATSTEISKGYLQAFWFPNISAEGVEGKPELMLRFLDESDISHKKVVDIFLSKSKNTGLEYNFDNQKYIRLIKRNFSDIPDNFFKFKEGHIEQYGVLRFTDSFSEVECDHRNHYAKFIAFKRQQKEKVDPDVIEKIGGCGGYLYQLSFFLKNPTDDISLKSEPVNGSSAIYKITKDDSIIKIKSIDSDWIYAAVSDSSKPDSVGNIRGYVKKSELRVLN